MDLSYGTITNDLARVRRGSNPLQKFPLKFAKLDSKIVNHTIHQAK